MRKFFKVFLISLLISAVFLTCKRHPLTNPVDPESENYIGYESIDNDGDGIGQWEDVDEIVLISPENGDTVTTISPTLFVYKFNPEKINKYRIQISTSNNDFDAQIIFSKEDYTSNECTIPFGVLDDNNMYYWRAKANDGNKWSDNWSEVWYFKIILPKAGTPVFNPSNGVYDSNQNITITSETEGCTIYYAIDGSTPTTSSAHITNGGIISISAGQIKAVAVRTGYSDSEIATASYGIKEWEYPILVNYSSPAVDSNGTIYVGSGNDLYAINPDGTLKWKYSTGGEFHAVHSSPTIGSDGTIYFGNEFNDIYALNPDGTLRWSFKADGSVSTSPSIGEDGTIYITSHNSLYAVNSLGTVQWSYTPGAVILSSPAIASDGTIYFGCWDYNLYALNTDGTLKWKFATADKVDFSPSIDSDGTIYIGNVAGNFYAVNADGTEKWKMILGGGSGFNNSAVISSSETIYFGDGSTKLYAINSIGTLQWSYYLGTGGTSIYSTPLIDTNGIIYFNSGDGMLNTINSEGDLIWSFNIGVGWMHSPTLITNGILYVGGDNLYKIKIGDSDLMTSPWPMFKRNERHTGRVAD